MIRDLSETLKALLTQPGLPAELAAAQINFDRPAEPFNPAQTTVNLFLFDVRENAELRSSEPTVDRRNGAAFVRPPPRRVSCSYLATAWPAGGSEPTLQEHRLLTQVLRVLSRYPVIPGELARGSLKTSDPPVPLQVALGTPATGVSEFWSALGAKLRPSLTVQATLALPVFDEARAPLAVTHTVVTGERQPYPAAALDPATQERAYALFGRVVTADGQPAGGAAVLLVEKGLQATAGGDGGFRLGPVPAGTYTLRATLGGATKDVQRTVPAPAGGYDIQFA